MDTLSSETGKPIQEFKADLTRKTPCRAEKRKCIEAEIVSDTLSTYSLILEVQHVPG